VLLLWRQLYTTLKLGKLQEGSWRTGAASCETAPNQILQFTDSRDPYDNGKIGGAELLGCVDGVEKQ